MVDDGTDLSDQCGGRFVEPVLGPQENDLFGPVGEECEERVEVFLRQVRAEFSPVVDDRYPGLDGDNVCTVADVLSGKDLEKAAKSIADRVISIGDANKPARSSTPPEPASKPPGTCNRKSPTSKNKTA